MGWVVYKQQALLLLCVLQQVAPLDLTCSSLPSSKGLLLPNSSATEIAVSVMDTEIFQCMDG